MEGKKADSYVCPGLFMNRHVIITFITIIIITITSSSIIFIPVAAFTEHHAISKYRVFYWKGVAISVFIHT